MLNNKVQIVYSIILPILVLGISFRFATFQLSLGVLLLLIFLSNKHTIGVFLLMYGGPLGGIIRDVYPGIPVYGILLQLFGVFLLWDVVCELFRDNIRAILWMLLAFLMFCFFYFIGPMDDFATNKLLNICLHGIMALFGYFAFERSTTIDIWGITNMLLIAAVCSFAYCITDAGMTPGDLGDFNWFREQWLLHSHNNSNERSLVSYQHIGMFVLFAAALYLSQTHLKVGLTLLILTCAFYLVLVSGCRQDIFGVALAITLRLIVFRDNNYQNKHSAGRTLWKITTFVGALTLLFLVLQNIESDVVSRTLTQGDASRRLFALQSVTIFKQNPFVGAGLGGFHAITGSIYPHNLLFELLSETGFLGLLGSLFLFIVPIRGKNQGLLHITKSNLFYFLIVFAIFIRVMVSSDLTESIELFCAVFAISNANLGSSTTRNMIEYF